MQQKLSRRTFALAGACGLALAGVAGAAFATDNKAAEGTSNKTDTAKSDADATAPKLSGTMKVVATNDTYTPLFDKFTEETGVKVEAISMSSGEVLSKLRAEGGTPDADLWFGGGIDAFMSAAEDGLLQKVEFDAAEQIDPTYRDADGYWYTKGITIVGFVTDNELLAEIGADAPQSWDDLLDPALAGEIVMSNPAVSGTNYAVVNALLQSKGEEEGWKYFQDLDANIAYYARRGSDPVKKVTAGEFAVGITYIDGTVDTMIGDLDCSVIYPSDGIPWVPEGVAVFANGENSDAAAYFIEWLFSDDTNLVLLSEIDQKTAVKVIKPSMEGIELDYDTSILMDEDLTLFGSQREDILADFEVLMGDKAVEEE